MFKKRNFTTILGSGLVLLSTGLLYSYTRKPKKLNKPKIIQETVTHKIKKKKQKKKAKKYQGLIMFEIHGILNNSNMSKDIIQICLNSGLAVGVCTSKNNYSLENLKQQKIIPKVLYNFLEENNFVNYSNVKNNILCGVENPIIHKAIGKFFKNMNNNQYFDWMKAFCIELTAEKLGIKNMKKVAFIDSFFSSVEAVKIYNSNFQTLCVNNYYNDILTKNSIVKLLKKMQYSS